MKFDAILKQLGDFGPYQKRLYLLLCLTAVSGGIQVMMSVFILATPDHRYLVRFISSSHWSKRMNNDTYQIQSTWHKEQIKQNIPSDNDKGEMKFSPCLWKESNTSKTPCHSWVYDKSVFQTTFITQENWVCDHTLMKSHVQMLFMVGSGLGSLLLSVPSDLIGRKRMMMLSIIIHISSCFALAFSPNFAMLGATSFLVGASVSGMFDNAFVIGMEFVGTSKRIWAGMIIEIFWSCGGILLATVAYFIRDWKTLQLTMAAPTLLFLSYYWLVPESPRWLISNGQHKSAEKILQRVANCNKITWTWDLENDASVTTETRQPVGRIVNKPWLLLGTGVIFLNWLVCSMGYYGLGLNVGNLGGSIYINFLISGLAETAGFVLCILLLDRIGRKVLHCSSMVIGGLACTASLFPVMYAPEGLNWITVTLAMTGRGFVSCAFGTIWVFTSELFPTVIRTSGMGASAMSARVGGIIAPYIANLANLLSGNVSKAVPLIIFGLCMIAAGLLSLLLPETLNRDLPETIQDADALFRISSRLVKRNRDGGDDVIEGNQLMTCQSDEQQELHDTKSRKQI